MSTDAATIQNETSYSQWGEDIVIWELFKKKTDGVFVEIGAHHPTKISQTYFFEQRGWSGVLVEPLKELYELLKANRPGSQVFHCGVAGPSTPTEARIRFPLKGDGGMSLAEVVFDREDDPHYRYESIALRTLNDIFQEAGLDQIDYLSIDVEGLEVEALRGLDFKRYRPKLILIEDHVENYEKHRFLKQMGYRFINRMGSNNWYVPNDFFDYTLSGRTSQFEFIRKFYLSMPFRKLRLALKSLS